MFPCQPPSSSWSSIGSINHTFKHGLILCAVQDVLWQSHASYTPAPTFPLPGSPFVPRRAELVGPQACAQSCGEAKVDESVKTGTIGKKPIGGCHTCTGSSWKGGGGE